MTTILVIEDMPSLREEILQMLELMDFQGIGAENGVQGVQLAQQGLPDLIICDIMLPELDGYGVLQTLRNDPETSTIPFIFLTARADRSDMRQGMTLGADDYLTKPFTSEELRGAIAAQLSKKEALILPYVTEMKRVAQQLGEMAYRDPVTGLPNRIQFQQQLITALSHAQRQQQALGVMCVRVGLPFAQANSGYCMSESLLRAVADRLMACLSHLDFSRRDFSCLNSVARLSGNEFSLFLTHIQSPQDLRKLAQTIQQALSAPFPVDGHLVSVETTIGATLYPEDNSTADALLNHAIAALKWGIQRGTPFQHYGDDVESAIRRNQAIKTSLAVALEQTEIEVRYQPQVHLITGQIVGAEALWQWNHPQLGVISSTSLFPNPDISTLMMALDEWLLKTVVKHIQHWQSLQIQPMRISVNVSTTDAIQSRLVNILVDLLAQTELSSAWLGLELPEAALEDVERITPILQQLRELGIHLTIDHFGMGYFSLTDLRRLPIHALKINPTLINMIPATAGDRAIVSVIMALAQNLHLEVFADGVDTDAQLKVLQQQGGQIGQGRLFKSTMSVHELEQILLYNQRCLAVLNPLENQP